FDPVDTSTPLHTAKDEVESPSVSNATALARFEFEPGRSKDGTKVLMVEWEEDHTTRNVRGDWHITWEGKSTVLRAEDQTNNDINRLYFLLPPGVAVPSIVTLTHEAKDNSRQPVVWRTNPLPAIFPPELGASARVAGKKGVLHTIWAKKRLQVLQKEIDAESKINAEGVGLQMAMQEKEWIEQNFGVAPKPLAKLTIPGVGDSPAPLSPSSPKSPGGGRLLEKLKGLKLGTSSNELGSSKKDTNDESPIYNPLSPETSDVAVSSFSAFKGERPAQHGGMASLNAFAEAPFASFESRAPPSQVEEDKEDDLFALPMSPRSPEMGKSPFSFAKSDTAKYI
ncbi:hypothetical protein M501DRAFT_917883, partial [Patellaria atrata CBS 101060]